MVNRAEEKGLLGLDAGQVIDRPYPVSFLTDAEKLTTETWVEV